MPSARTGGCFPPKPSARLTSTPTPTTRGRSGRTSGASSERSTSETHALNIPAYNGGLFAEDPRPRPANGARRGVPLLPRPRGLRLPTAARGSRQTADNGAKLVDVDILGHIFEQSITDLERLRNELEGLTERQDREQHISRTKEGRCLLHPRLHHPLHRRPGPRPRARRERLRLCDESTATTRQGTARRVLANPRSYDLKALNEPAENGPHPILGRLAGRAREPQGPRPGMRQRSVSHRSLRAALSVLTSGQTTGLRSFAASGRFSTSTGRFCRTTSTAWT